MRDAAGLNLQTLLGKISGLDDCPAIDANKRSMKNGGILSRLTMAVLLALVAAAGGTLLSNDVTEAQDRQGSLQQEIAQVEQEVDRIEADALAAIPSLLPGSPARVAGLRKTLFYDKALSVNRNE